MKRLSALMVYILCLSGCSKAPVDARTEVDLIIHNAKVVTMNDAMPVASAVAVAGTEIVAVGGEEILAEYRSTAMTDLDGDRLQHNNPLRTPMNHGVRVAISSDILPIGPMVGIYAAVTRKGMSGEVFGEEESLTVLEALRAYTLYGAWLTFEEDRKGSIEPGKLADMIVLDQDILTVDQDHIMDINVEQTWLGGKLVYERQ